MSKTLSPIHPGEIIREEFLVPMEASVNRLAQELGIGAARLGTTAEFWMGLQADYELRVARYREMNPK